MSIRALGVLAGTDAPDSLVERWAASADRLYGADSGADVLLRLGFRPTVVGDLDSFVGGAQRAELRVIEVPEQEHTDCDKLLALLAEDGASAVVLANAEGDQPDHFLATLGSAVRSSVRVRFAFRRGIGWVVRGGEAVEFDTRPGRRVSAIPILPSTGVDLQGVAWPLDGADLSQDGLVSVSNRAESERVSCRVGSGALLLFVEVPVEEMPCW